MVKKFEVGKRYEHISGVIRDCVFSGDRFVILKDGCGYEHSFQTTTYGLTEHWSEYHEPVRQKFVRTVITDSNGHMRVIKDHFACPTDTIVGRIEITVTDGKLTDVKIL